MNELGYAEMGKSAMIGGQDVQRRNMTVRENIDNKISMLNAEVARLEASKGTLGPLLDMRIADIRDAMSY